MGNIRQYLITVLSAAIVCAILIKLTGKQQLSTNLIRLVASVFLSLCVIAPILKLDVSVLTNELSVSKQEGEYIAEQASAEALYEIIAIIKERSETYIENKADTYGADINTTVTLSDPTTLVPDGVIIEGNVSPYLKKVLSNIISEDLGIPEDKQIWS